MTHYASGSWAEKGMARTKSDAPSPESDVRTSSEAKNSRKIPETRKNRAKCARAIQSACQVVSVTAGK